MVRTPAKALEWAKGESLNPSQNWLGKCLVFSRSTYDVPAKYGSAAEAWSHTTERYGIQTTPPAGALVWWTGGRHGYGHVVLSAGDGWCWSSDKVRAGKVDLVRISSITRDWGLTYQGWTTDINGVQVLNLPTPKPVLRYVAVHHAAKTSSKLPKGKLLKAAVAKEVGPKLLRMASPVLGIFFRRRYRAVQQKHDLLVNKVKHPLKHYSGIPDRASLAWLGHRHGFKVI